MDNKTEEAAIKLVVKSADDVTMLSAFLQDGLIAGHDIHFDKARAEVVMVVDRYRWEDSAERKERVLMGIRIGKVTACLQKKMQAGRQQSTPVFYNLLQLSYEEGQDGQRSLLFTFSAGAALRLIIDDLMMSAGDIAPPRPAIAQPSHDRPES